MSMELVKVTGTEILHLKPDEGSESALKGA